MLFIDDESYMIPREGDLHEVMKEYISDQKQYIFRLIRRRKLLKEWLQNSETRQFKFEASNE
jgi:hypothetical protein